LELKLFTNDEVLAANQKGTNPRQLYKKDGAMVWYSQIPGSKDIYAALFNIGDTNKSIAIDFAAIGLTGKTKVRDLWKKQDIGQFKKGYQQNINLHGATLLRLSPANN
jgi:hypothetical protein